MFKRTILILLIGFLSIQMHAQQATCLRESAYWIIGTWKVSPSQYQLFEHWSVQDDSTFNGISFYFQAADTVVTEKMQLLSRNGILYFVPTVPSQNDGKAVIFKAYLNQAKKMAFNNPRHDFPQEIIYQLNNPDWLQATISGQTPNGYQKVTFDLQRINY